MERILKDASTSPPQRMNNATAIQALQHLRLPLLRHTAALLPQPEEAEDVVQDVLIRMWLLRERFRNEEAMSRLAHVATRNAALNVLRKTRVATTPIDALQHGIVPACDEDPHDSLEHKENIRHIQALMQGLTTRGRAFLQMRADGLSYTEIAAISGCTEVNVRSQVCRARQWLLEQLRSKASTPSSYDHR